MSKNKRYLKLFLFIVALPGMGLIALGVRTLHQEKMAVEQEIRTRLDSVGNTIEENINREFDQWIDCLRDLPEWTRIDPENLPQCLGVALTDQQGSMLLKMRDRRVETIPGNALLYSLESAEPSASAEDSDIRSLYARSKRLREKGRNSEAIAIYENMRRYPKKRLGGVPADFIADLEICSLCREMSQTDALSENSLAFYENLVGGRWLLEKPRYLSYAAIAKEWLRSTGQLEAMNRLVRLENHKLEMTEIVRNRVLRIASSLQDQTSVQEVIQTKEGVVIAFLYRMAPKEPVLALLLSPATLAGRFWPAVFSRSDVDKCNTTITTSGGVPLYASIDQSNPYQFNEERFIRVGASNWNLNVWPRDEGQFYSDLKRRQVIYISIFVLFIISLGFAVYFSARTLYQELEVARLKENFVSAVSHEFRTPLTGIRQLAEMLVAGRVSGDEKRSRYYSMILQESDQMARMVENLLAYARGTANNSPFHMERIETNRWLRETALQFQHSVAGSGANVTINIADSLPAITGDPDALTLALTNLMDNAVKYSPKGTPVEIEAEANKGGVTIRVIDRGIGISDEDKKKIFERFYRGIDTSVQQKRGTGLGLNLVHDIVSGHHGNIKVDSTLGEGSVFTVSLPAARDVDHGELS
jgi:signal transduction histidine kinase